MTAEEHVRKNKLAEAQKAKDELEKKIYLINHNIEDLKTQDK